MFNRLVCFIVFVYLRLPGMYGEEDNYRIFETVSVGSEASTVSCFFQDSLGLVWIGSQQHSTFG